MIKLVIFLVIVVAVQVAIFLYTRKLKRQNKRHVLTRYNINTAKDAWEQLQNPDLPEEDREQIQKYYEGER